MGHSLTKKLRFFYLLSMGDMWNLPLWELWRAERLRFLEFCSGVLSQHLLFFIQVWYIVSEGENKNEKIINHGDNLTIFRKRKQERQTMSDCPPGCCVNFNIFHFWELTLQLLRVTNILFLLTRSALNQTLRSWE